MRTLGITILAAAAVLTGPASAQDAPAGDTVRGRQSYEALSCSACHGTTGAGGGLAGPKLAPGPLPWEAFEAQVRHPAKRMPPYRATVLPQQELADIYAYLGSLAPGPAAGDIAQLRR